MRVTKIGVQKHRYRNMTEMSSISEEIVKIHVSQGLEMWGINLEEGKERKLERAKY